MDQKDRDRWIAAATELLEATADDEEQWSFLFRRPGSIDLLYCPWDAVADWEFDGDVSCVALLWDRNRLKLIKGGKIDPNEQELAIWRRKKCQELASGSDWSVPAWIVPLRESDQIVAWALCVCQSQEDIDPYVEGVFDNPESARKALGELGAIGE